MQKPYDKEAERELTLFAENDSLTYHNYIQKTVIPYLVRRIKQGNYDREKSLSLWRNAVNLSAKHYCRNFGGVWSKVFPSEVRANVTINLRDSMEHIAFEIANDGWKEVAK